jgi:molybdopterin biosynthesis enzyme
LTRSAENENAVEQALADPDADAVLVIGGTGEGRRDRSVLALARMGEVKMHGMGVRPGESAALGSVDGRPVLLLPGRIDAALAVWLIVGRRLLARLSGADADSVSQPVTLTRKIVSTFDRGLGRNNIARPLRGRCGAGCFGPFPVAGNRSRRRLGVHPAR